MKENLIIKVIKSLRMPEAFLVSGFIFIGCLFGIYEAGFYKIITLAVVFFISYTLMLSVYSLNAYLGFNDDKANPRLKELNLFSKTYYLGATIGLYAASLVASLILNTNNFYFHIIIFVFWFLYSIPGFGKHLPIVGTLIHFIVAIVQFNFAYSFFSPISESSVLISFYFAILFSAGHLHHEIIDYEADAQNGIKSNAVLWGIKKMKYFSFGFFVMAYLFLIFLYHFSYINLIIYIIFGPTAFLQLVFFLLYYRNFETDLKARINYRLVYRIVFSISGVVFTYYTLFQNTHHAF
jgi:4-hydroxybenzoate polyprenyltransferase